MSEDGWQVSVAIEKGRPPPSWFLEVEPDIYEGDEFYLKAFNELSTCRHVGSSTGPIPWRDVMAYAEHKGLDEDVADVFLQVIREMDAGYLNWIKENQEKENRKKAGETNSVDAEKEY